MIQNWLFTISGYMQDRGQALQGITGLYHDLYQDLHDNVNLVPCEWNSDWNTMAEWCFRLSMNGPGAKPRVGIVAYSWGGGYGFLNLAAGLAERGVDVEFAVLSDAVYHWGPRWTHTRFIVPWLVGPAQAAAYWPWLGWPEWFRPKIRVPANVKSIHWFTQHNSMLRGHDLVWKNDGMPCPNHTVVDGDVTHSYMDENPLFRETAKRIAHEHFCPPPPKRIVRKKK
jgi:hypothetical protein